MQKDLYMYYSNRAKEYESVYNKPERQADINILREKIKEYFFGKNVLEVACGTGYWTQFIAQTAATVFAADFSTEVLEIAKAKKLPDNTHFQQADIYDLKWIDKIFNAVFGGFIWSHIPIQKTELFLRSVHSVLMPGAKVFFTDNIYVEGNSTPISHTDESGNTYQKRKLKDGSEYIVLKNFPTEENIKGILSKSATDIRFEKLDYFWILTYTLK